MRTHVWLGLLLALLTLVGFWEIQNHEFVDYDDNVYVFSNAFVTAGLTEQSVRWAFASGKHPLTWLSHMLDVEIYGVWTGGHHRTNLLFHLANVLLLFYVLRRATGAVWRSAAVAALFAIHPLHVESVAWASERKDVLSAFFWLLCTGAYLRYVERPGIGRYLWVALFLVLGLLSKSMLVTLPFTLLLLDYWPLGRFGQDGKKSENSTEGVDGEPGEGTRPWSILVEKIPLFALSALASLFAFQFQSASGTIGLLPSVSFTDRIANALVAYASYIYKTFWPVDLIFFYPHPEVSLGGVEVGAAALLLAAISLVAWRTRGRGYPIVGWLWFIGTLVPVIGLVQIGKQAMADRYTYVPHIGLFVAIVWGTAALTSSWRGRKAWLAAAAVVIVLALTAATRLQVAHWRDSFSLAAHAIEVRPDNALAHHVLGLALAKRGEPDEAIEQYLQAIEFEPDFVNAYVDLASALDTQGKTNDAIAELARALAIEPGHAIANYNLGMVQARLGEGDAAIAALRRAIGSNPSDPSAHFGLGSVLASEGRFDEAERRFREALRRDPQNAAIYAQLGAVYAMLNRFDAAIETFETALRIDPTLEMARQMLDVARQKKSESLRQ